MEERLPYQEDRSSQLLLTVLLALVAAVICGVAWGLVGKWTSYLIFSSVEASEHGATPRSPFPAPHAFAD